MFLKLTYSLTYYPSLLETCVPQLKVEKGISSIQRKKNDEVKQEQADSSNVTVITEDLKKETFNSSNSDLTDSNEAEAKEIDADRVDDAQDDVVQILGHANDTSVTEFTSTDLSDKENTQDLEKGDCAKVNATMDIKHSKNLRDKGLKSLDISVELKRESSKNNEDSKKENTNGNSIIGVKKEVTPIVIDEDNIQDEELDHEVDEEEIKGNTENFNDTVGKI